MQAFLTGSQVYGTPTAKSDIDLVVLLSDEDRELLHCLVDESEEKIPGRQQYGGYGIGSLNLKFGRLNLIVAENEKEWQAWRAGTTSLLTQAPVTRDKAVETFKGLRERLCK
jgi:hypothetical protein